ncbi:hypothetical protein SAMN05428940_7236 [Streptomyces sp. 2133.1]|nr:hypothetical protein SAMN05428940_7236 [Streptomyces sp. 2133.1]
MSGRAAPLTQDSSSMAGSRAVSRPAGSSSQPSTTSRTASTVPARPAWPGRRRRTRRRPRRGRRGPRRAGVAARWWSCGLPGVGGPGGAGCVVAGPGGDAPGGEVASAPQEGGAGAVLAGGDGVEAVPAGRAVEESLPAGGEGLVGAQVAVDVAVDGAVVFDQPALQLGVALALGQAPAVSQPRGEGEGLDAGAVEGGAVPALGRGVLVLAGRVAGRPGQPVAEERVCGLLAIAGGRGSGASRRRSTGRAAVGAGSSSRQRRAGRCRRLR